MVDGIAFHELGHLLTNRKLKNNIYKRFLYRVEKDEHITAVLNEALADWYIEEDGSSGGAIYRFIEISKVDIKRATRCFWIYLSDCWFVEDDKKDVFKLRTDVMTGLALKFLNTDGSVDFIKMQSMIKDVCRFLFNEYNSIGMKSMNIIKKGHYYDKTGKNITYKELEKIAILEYNEKYPNNTTEDIAKLEIDYGYWDIVWEYVKMSEEIETKIDKFFIDKGRRTTFKILNKFGGNESLSNKFNSLREYIYSRYKELGVLKEPEKPNIHAIVNKISDEINLSSRHKKRVLSEFDTIISGKCRPYICNLRGRADPFIRVLQEMLFRIGFLNIITPAITFGGSYNLVLEGGYFHIKKLLEIIKKELEMNMYEHIDKMVINNKYLDITLGLLDMIRFSSGRRLRLKIKSIEHRVMGNQIFELYIPFHSGKMDMNTINAIDKINSTFRIHEELLRPQWTTIDRKFIELLAESLIQK